MKKHVFLTAFTALLLSLCIMVPTVAFATDESTDNVVPTSPTQSTVPTSHTTTATETTTAPISTEPLTTPPITIYGDANSDGNVTMADVILVQKHIAHQLTLTQEQQTFCNVDNAGDITMKDAVLIQQYIAFIISELPYNAEKEALIPHKIELNNSAICLQPGENYVLRASVTPSTAIYTLQWSSSAPAVADVDDNGNITAISAGEAIITVSTDNGINSRCTVTVRKAPTSVTLNEANITLDKNQTFQLTATVPEDCYKGEIIYQSSNEAIASVDKNGLITGQGDGTVAITATTYNGKTASCNVTVFIGSIQLNRSTLTLGTSESYGLLTTISNTSSTNVTWLSSDENVATVSPADGKGIVVSKGVGTAIITAVLPNGNIDSCTVTVKKAPSSVSLNAAKMDLIIGNYYDLKMSVPNDCYAWYYYFTSSNENIVSVDKYTGKVIAKNIGTATVTVFTYNGASATCKINVLSMELSDVAFSQLGNGPKKYRNWFYGYYASEVPWCAVFVSWCADNTPISVDVLIPHTDGAGCFAREGVANGLGKWYEGGNTPRVGDIITFCWNELGSYPGEDKYYSDHVGIVISVTDKQIITIEGNASADINNNSNDNTTVMRRVYNIDDNRINGFYRPNYTASLLYY